MAAQKLVEDLKQEQWNVDQQEGKLSAAEKRRRRELEIAAMLAKHTSTAKKAGASLPTSPVVAGVPRQSAVLNETPMERMRRMAREKNQASGNSPSPVTPGPRPSLLTSPQTAPGGGLPKSTSFGGPGGPRPSLLTTPPGSYRPHAGSSPSLVFPLNLTSSSTPSYQTLIIEE